MAPHSEMGGSWEQPGCPLLGSVPAWRQLSCLPVLFWRSSGWSLGSRSEGQVPTVCGLTSLGPCTYPIRLSSVVSCWALLPAHSQACSHGLAPQPYLKGSGRTWGGLSLGGAGRASGPPSPSAGPSPGLSIAPNSQCIWRDLSKHIKDKTQGCPPVGQLGFLGQEARPLSGHEITSDSDLGHKQDQTPICQWSLAEN